MSDLSSELNLALAVDDDDTADYLTQALYDSLNTIDGLFNQSTGHNHAGAHQGGALELLDVTVEQDLTVIGESDLKGPVVAENTLHVMSDSSLDGALHVGGATQLDGAITTTQIDGLYGNTVATPSTSPYAVGTKIMYVFCQVAMTVNFPPAASTSRPIEVYAVNGQVTLAGGTFIGGSINLSTGAAQNGIVITGDAITYKSDGASWRAV